MLTFIYLYKLTLGRTIFQRANLLSGQGSVVNLNTRDFSLEPALLSTLYAKPDRKLGTKLDLTNVPTLHHFPVMPQLCDASHVVVRGTHCVPLLSLRERNTVLAALKVSRRIVMD